MTLRSGDAALVMRDNGTSELLRHHYEPDEAVPINVVALTAIAMRIASDHKFCEELLAWYRDQHREENPRQRPL